MAFATLQATMMYPHYAGWTPTEALGASISASGKFAIIFRAPATGSISSVAFFVQSASALVNFAVQLMNVNEAANPDGVIDQQVTFTDVIVAGAHMVVTPKITTDGNPASAGRSVTKGELVAMVISSPGNLAASVIVAMRIGDYMAASEPHARGVAQSIGAATWIGNRQSVPMYALNYKNLGWVNNGVLNYCNNFGDFSLSVAGSPDEAGSAFVLKVPMVIDGYVFMNGKASITGTIRVALYDAPDGTTTLTAIEMRTVWGQTTSLAIMTADFGGNFTLTSSVTYFIGIRPLGAYTFNGWNHEFSLTAVTAASPYGENYWKAQRTDLGAWTIVRDRITISALRVTGLGGAGGAGGATVTVDISKARLVGRGH